MYNACTCISIFSTGCKNMERIKSTERCVWYWQLRVLTIKFFIQVFHSVSQITFLLLLLFLYYCFTFASFSSCSKKLDMIFCFKTKFFLSDIGLTVRFDSPRYENKHWHKRWYFFIVLFVIISFSSILLFAAWYLSRKVCLIILCRNSWCVTGWCLVTFPLKYFSIVAIVFLFGVNCSTGTWFCVMICLCLPRYKINFISHS